MAFVVTFRRARVFFVRWEIAHWLKLAIGGLLTGLCGLLFLKLYPGNLMPIGPNYEAVGDILGRHHATTELLTFSILKLAATIFTLASGGVSAMFVPLFLTGGALGTAFAQSVVHSPALGLYAAVGMASRSLPVTRLPWPQWSSLRKRQAATRSSSRAYRRCGSVRHFWGRLGIWRPTPP